MLRRLVELLVLRRRSEDRNAVEILLLRHELTVLRRQVARPRCTLADRVVLGALAQALPSDRKGSLFVRPETLHRWHRELVTRRWTYRRATTGRRPTRAAVRDLVLRLARENQTWGYVSRRVFEEAQVPRKGYPPEFRRRALELLRSGRSVAELARLLEVSDASLYIWRRPGPDRPRRGRRGVLDGACRAGGGAPSDRTARGGACDPSPRSAAVN
jgi:hypothetical protein